MRFKGTPLSPPLGGERPQTEGVAFRGKLLRRF